MRWMLLFLLCSVAQARQYPDTAAGYLTLFDRNGDGRIAASEYVAYLSAGFRTLDTNGDAVLDAHELPPGPHRTPRTLAAFQADVRAEFHRLDGDRNGYLDERELAQPPR